MQTTSAAQNEGNIQSSLTHQNIQDFKRLYDCLSENIFAKIFGSMRLLEGSNNVISLYSGAEEFRIDPKIIILIPIWSTEKRERVYSPITPSPLIRERGKKSRTRNLLI